MGTLDEVLKEGKMGKMGMVMLGLLAILFIMLMSTLPKWLMVSGCILMFVCWCYMHT